MDNYIDLLFTTGPHADGEFVESENMQGQSIRAGEWLAPGTVVEDQYWRLRIRPEVFYRDIEES